ncbi:hypothetical protein HDU97_007930 [Phlyctochytrium planicorne]|nr:hypothetical protein HDU97_007930 [Phlyctochytrium planicorne]
MVSINSVLKMGLAIVSMASFKINAMAAPKIPVSPKIPDNTTPTSGLAAYGFKQASSVVGEAPALAARDVAQIAMLLGCYTFARGPNNEATGFALGSFADIGLYQTEESSKAGIIPDDGSVGPKVYALEDTTFENYQTFYLSGGQGTSAETQLSGSARQAGFMDYVGNLIIGKGLLYYCYRDNDRLVFQAFVQSDDGSDTNPFRAFALMQFKPSGTLKGSFWASRRKFSILWYPVSDPFFFVFKDLSCRSATVHSVFTIQLIHLMHLTMTSFNSILKMGFAITCLVSVGNATALMAPKTQVSPKIPANLPPTPASGLGTYGLSQNSSAIIGEAAALAARSGEPAQIAMLMGCYTFARGPNNEATGFALGSFADIGLYQTEATSKAGIIPDAGSIGPNIYGLDDGTFSNTQTWYLSGGQGTRADTKLFGYARQAGFMDYVGDLIDWDGPLHYYCFRDNDRLVFQAFVLSDDGSDTNVAQCSAIHYCLFIEYLPPPITTTKVVTTTRV